MFNTILRIYNVFQVWLIIALLLLPYCENRNMDMNGVPQTQIVVKNTRFSYKKDLIEPVGCAILISVACPVTAPLITYYDYKLLTDKDCKK